MLNKLYNELVQTLSVAPQASWPNRGLLFLWEDIVWHDETFVCSKRMLVTCHCAFARYTKLEKITSVCHLQRFFHHAFFLLIPLK